MQHTKHVSLALFALSMAACVDPGAAPPTSSVQPSIIGGTTAKPANFPTVVELEGQPTEFECTGTLIDASWVMTAAHCFEDLTATTGHIRFDGNDMLTDPTGTVVDIKSVHVDPAWTGATDWVWTHDMSLVELKTPQTRAVTPLYLDAVAPGTTVLTVGYGNDNNTNGGAGILRQLSTPTMDCAGTSDPNMKNANVMCFDGRDSTSSCYGDSGGPAFLTVGGVQTVAGETSGGTLQTEACTGPNAFYAYTEVSAEIAFIQQYVPQAITNGISASGGSDTSGSGSDTGDGGGGSDPTQPDPTQGSGSPSPTQTPPSADVGGGCNAAGGSAGGLMILGALVGLASLARRRGH